MKIAKLQLTLAIIKPDVIANPIVTKEIHKVILDNDFFFVRSRQLFMPRQQAEGFYAEHKGKFFFNRLASYMSSGPISSHVLARRDAIGTWRQLMGPTKVFKTVYEAPNSIRGRFGLTDTRNCTHGSDSEESARREINFFFPDFDVDEWYKTQEAKFTKDNLVFDSSLLEHRLINDDS